MTAIKIVQDSVVFRHPSLPADKECRTWYRIHGDLSPSSGRRPLVVVPGGPGVTHLAYLASFSDMPARDRIPVIWYDQLGSGRSTHLRERRLDAGLWTMDLMLAELDNLLTQLGLAAAGSSSSSPSASPSASFDLYGHSAGAMVAARFAASAYPSARAINKLVLASGPCYTPDWTAGCEAMIARMPAWVRDAVERCTREGNLDAPEYQAAMGEVYRKHLCRLDPWPAEVEEALGELSKDDTLYVTTWGLNELVPTGSLKDYDMRQECKNITQPTLLINGEFDECADVCIWPWFNGIPKVKWVKIMDASHLINWEQPDKYREAIVTFLNNA